MSAVLSACGIAGGTVKLRLDHVFWPSDRCMHDSGREWVRGFGIYLCSSWRRGHPWTIIITGTLPVKQRKLVEAWVALNEDELRAAWKVYNESGEVIKFKGLE